MQLKPLFYKALTIVSSTIFCNYIFFYRDSSFLADVPKHNLKWEGYLLTGFSSSLIK